MNRREFIGRTAGAVGGALLIGDSGEVWPKAKAPSDQINLGIVGVGSRGQQLMRTFLRVPGVRFAGLCDVYEPRFAAGRSITKENTPIYRDYQQLLAARDLDAVIVSTPLSLHSQHMVAVLESGRHLYGEKCLGLTVEDCYRIVDAVKRSGKHFQVGLQYHYAPWFSETLRHIQAGKIGRVTEIYAYWHRNNSWKRPVPAGADQKLERLINWRLYKEYSGGLVAELGSHHINFANEVFGSAPESVLGSGGIDFWKDGRETNDNVRVIYRYPQGTTLVFSAITTNQIDGAQVRVYGTNGTAVLTEADATLYYEPKRPQSAVSEGTVLEHGITTSASFRAELPYRGPGEPVPIPEDRKGNADFVACNSFIESLRKNQRPEADEQTALADGLAVALGNQAIDQGKRILFSEHMRSKGA
ncbi:MAG TPA: Gfo/Idh/MocA family oxidoreductase [Candidatus Dormibacteraeota bacterium]|nr:Gfo/Idh/MocA family oxidoreductase [Candidatus Dormibacteraeota bacterium]